MIIERIPKRSIVSSTLLLLYSSRPQWRVWFAGIKPYGSRNGVWARATLLKVRLNDSTMHHNFVYGLQAYGEGIFCGGAMLLKVSDSTMHHNGESGLQAYGHAVVNLHGTKTDIHSNESDGIEAAGNAKVNIHLPSQHNTTHDNVGENRFQWSGGSIANINVDGTFTHVEEVHNDEEDDD